MFVMREEVSWRRRTSWWFAVVGAEVGVVVIVLSSVAVVVTVVVVAAATAVVTVIIVVVVAIVVMVIVYAIVVAASAVASYDVVGVVDVAVVLFFNDQVHRHLALQTAYVAVAEIVTQLMNLRGMARILVKNQCKCYICVEMCVSGDVCGRSGEKMVKV